MKKVIFGLALFAGSFALANESFNNAFEIINESSAVKVVCNCELSPEGTCIITVYGNGYGNPPTGTYTYYNVSLSACRQLAAQHAGWD